MLTDIFHATPRTASGRANLEAPMATAPFVPGLTASARDDVLASEAATYPFCAKAWHLEHALRRQPSETTVQRRSEGTALHDEHGARIGTIQRIGRRLVAWSVGLLILTGVLVLLALLANR